MNPNESAEYAQLPALYLPKTDELSDSKHPYDRDWPPGIIIDVFV